jgi:chitodextrinase
VVAARKHTVLAAVTIATFAAFALVSGAVGSRGWKRDTVAPTAPANLRVTASTSSSVTVSWDAARDERGLAGYLVYAAGRRSFVRGTTFVAWRLDCGESYPVSVRAIDFGGNRSSALNGTVTTTACADLQAPSAPSGFRQSATTQSAVILSWKPSWDNVGVTRYDVYQRLLPPQTSIQPNITLSELSCGSVYQYTVDAVDAAGNHSGRSDVWVKTAACDDSQPPTTPSHLSVSGRTRTSLSVSWGPSNDNVAVAGYRVWNGSALASTLTSTNATLSKLACGTPYTIGVDAFDSAGNQSGAARVSGSTAACPSQEPPTPPSPPAKDTTAPSTPKGLAVTSVTDTTISVAWSDSTDDTGVEGYGVYLDGKQSTTTPESPATVSGLSCGATYTLGIDAYDAARNHSSAATLDAATAPCSPAPPSPAPPAPPPPPSPPVGDTAAPSQPDSFVLSGATRTSVSLTWAASTDNVGVAGYRVYLDGSAAGTTVNRGYTVSGLTCGAAHTFAVDAYDAAGNRSAKSQVVGSTSACPDTQAPSAPANVVTTSRTATSVALSWAASSDNVGVAGYDLYRAGTSVGTTNTTTGIVSALACDTSYTLSVDAYDGAGNHSQKSNVTVSTTPCPDTSPPSTPKSFAASNATQTDLKLTWGASTDDVGVTGYDVFRNGSKVGSAAATSSSQSGLTCGTSYAFAVDAYDAAGNTSSQATLNASTASCPAPAPPPAPPAPPSPPPPPAPSGCAVDPATMTAPGCSLLRSDTASATDPKSGLWGSIAAASDSRAQWMSTGGTDTLMASGGSQGNKSYRLMTLLDGDNSDGERSQLGHNTSSGENAPGQTSGTFAVYKQGDHKITFFSQRYSGNFDPNAGSWQQIGQLKQAEPYSNAVPTGVALELQLYGGKLHLENFWTDKWTTSAPAKNAWIRYALDVVFSTSASTGKFKLYVDLNGDGDALDSGEQSPWITGQTLATESSSGKAIPSSLMLGMYHDSSIPCPGPTGCQVGIDNVEVVGG